MKTPTAPRTEAFPCEGPCELELRVREGRIAVKSGDVDHVRVELATPDDQTDERSVGETRVEYSGERRRLVVRAPRSFHRGGVNVFVETPSGSKVDAAAHRGSISVSGKLSSLVAVTGGGTVEAEEIDGPVKVASGSGSLTLGRITGPLKARLGNGDIELSSVESPGASLTTGHGDVRLGVVGGNAKVRTGKGSVVVSEVASGNLELVTGGGNLRAGVRAGVAAELDVVSGSGQARSELDVTDQPAPGAPVARIRMRTGSGEAVVSRAT
jgi:hypothetical protein